MRKKTQSSGSLGFHESRMGMNHDESTPYIHATFLFSVMTSSRQSSWTSSVVLAFSLSRTWWSHWETMRQNCGKTVVNPTINLAFGKSLIPPIDGDLGDDGLFFGFATLYIYDYMILYVCKWLYYIYVNEAATGWYVHYIEWYLEEIGFAGWMLTIDT